MKPALSTYHSARALGLSALLSLTGVALAGETQVFSGEPVAVGNGTARVVMTTNSGNEPDSLSVMMTRDALEGLPEASADQEVWFFTLPMPENAPETGYNHVVLDWNPSGHLPEGIYSVPHFDVHFYLISNDDREAITFHGGNREMAMTAPDQQLVPEGYVMPPDAAVDKMGMHALDPAGPEFQGEAFSHNFIYGYYKGELIFVEPMISLAFLQSLPEQTSPVKKPQRYSYPAWYPASYQIGFDAGNDEYRIALRDLQRFD